MGEDESLFPEGDFDGIDLSYSNEKLAEAPAQEMPEESEPLVTVEPFDKEEEAYFSGRFDACQELRKIVEKLTRNGEELRRGDLFGLIDGLLG